MSHSTVNPPPASFHTLTLTHMQYMAFPYVADSSRQALCSNISAEWNGCTVQRAEEDGARWDKNFVLPSASFQ